MLTRVASRRLGGWALILFALGAIPIALLAALADSSAVDAAASIVALALVAPAYLYLGRRLTPVGGIMSMRLATLYVLVTALDTAAWILAAVRADLTWIADAANVLAVASLVPFVWLMAEVGRGDQALPWLPALRVAVIVLAVGYPIVVSIDPLTADIEIVFLMLCVGVGVAVALGFELLWSFVVGRRLLREEG